MDNYNRFTLPTSLLITALGLGLTVDAQAATQFRNFVQNATGACQSALPVFDGQIRKRAPPRPLCPARSWAQAQA